MIRRQHGFTMVELLITMVIFVLTIAAASSIFVPLLTQFKQQSKIAETSIEGIVGIDILRRDIEQAGFGLPWNLPAAVTYNEGSATATPGFTFTTNNVLIDDSAANNPPRALASVNNNLGPDYFVVKATSVPIHNAAIKWTHVTHTAAGADEVKIWGSPVEDLIDGDRVIALIPSRGSNPQSQRILVHNAGAFSVTFNSTTFPAAFAPGSSGDLHLIYGINPSFDLRMPFNRGDYYVRTTGATIPPRCAPGTGILMKSLIVHGNMAGYAPGDRGPETPLIDCVADMQVIFQLDTDGDGTLDNQTNDISGLTALEIREQVKEVRMYILTHEGQKDITYTYPEDTPTVGEFGLGRDVDLTAITDWDNYRWKIYRLVVQPNNLE
jgi:prepilin-type N-terminal cleavage/methylation domain-containing protein